MIFNINLSLSSSWSLDVINSFMKVWKVWRLVTDSLMAAMLVRMALNTHYDVSQPTCPLYLCISTFSVWTWLRFSSMVDLICSM